MNVAGFAGKKPHLSFTEFCKYTNTFAQVLQNDPQGSFPHFTPSVFATSKNKNPPFFLKKKKSGIAELKLVQVFLAAML